jgi:hypothetical protein
MGIIMTSVFMLNAQQKFPIQGINYQVTSAGTVEIVAPSCWSGHLTVPATIFYMDHEYLVSGIGSVAFSGCNGLTGVTLINTITRIGNGAFANCSELQSINIPEAVTSIGEGVFANCNKLANIIVEPNNPYYSAVNGILFNKSQSKLIQYPTGKTGHYDIPPSVNTIAAHAFTYCGRLTSITIPSTVTRIEDWAFAYCSELSVVNFNATNCTYMGSKDKPVFENCSSLGTIKIGNNVQSIPDYAFSACSGLKTITVPVMVTSIGKEAFANVSLESLYVNAVSPPYIYSNTFPYYLNEIPVYVPCGTVGTYTGASVWKDFTNIEENTPKYNIILLSNNQAKGTVAITRPNICGNSTVVITATAESGYAFVRWNDGDTQNPRTFVVTQDTTFTASFAPVYHVEVSQNNTAMGSVHGGGDFSKNATTTLRATPFSGYRFVQWNDGNTQNPRKIMVTQHATYTATFEVTTTNPNISTAIADVKTSTIAIYPNPATDNITIVLPNNVSHASFTLYDLQGKAVIQKNINSRHVISVKHLASGMYIYNVVAGKERYTGKITRK